MIEHETIGLTGLGLIILAVITLFGTSPLHPKSWRVGIALCFVCVFSAGAFLFAYATLKIENESEVAQTRFRDACTAAGGTTYIEDNEGSKLTCLKSETAVKVEQYGE